MRIIALIFSFLIVTFSFGQKKENLADRAEFDALFDSLNTLSEIMIKGRGPENRIKASYSYLSLLEEGLNRFQSFEYPFDSLDHISIQTADDNNLRIFTWDLLFSANHYRHLGIIQYIDKKKVLHVKVLNDFSDHILNPMDTVNTADKWYGCFYYKIMTKKSKGKTKYYLFGWDMNDAVTYKKLIDVLWFSGEKMYFGAKDFYFEEYKEWHYKFVMEYKRDATTTLNYDEDRNIIIFDHLTMIGKSQTSNSDRDIMIPDGSYHGFEWKKGRWNFIDKVFHFRLNDGQAPVGNR